MNYGTVNYVTFYVNYVNYCELWEILRLSFPQE